MAHSYLLAGATAGMHVRVACPADYSPDERVVADADAIAVTTGGSVTIYTDPLEAAAGADVIVTDTWVSMGKEEEKAERVATLGAYRVDADLMAVAKPDAIFLHCLPADRGYEVTSEVIDGPQSVIWDEAENRLHAQKALLIWLLEQRGDRSAAARPPALSESRIVGIDVARGLAVLGMFGAHIGVTTPWDWTDPSTWLDVVNGRSSILFATLAGVSIAILSGRDHPVDGADLRAARIRILVRAAAIFLLGALLELLGTNVGRDPAVLRAALPVRPARAAAAAPRCCSRWPGSPRSSRRPS